MAEFGVNRRAPGRVRGGWGHVGSANGSAPRDLNGGRLEQLALSVDGEDGSTLPRPRDARPSRRRTPSLGAAVVDDGGSTPALDDADGDRARGRTGTQSPDAAGAVEPPLVLTVPQLEAALQLGRTRAYELIRSGDIPVLRVGRLVRISRAALERWIAERSLSTISASPDSFGHLP